MSCEGEAVARGVGKVQQAFIYKANPSNTDQSGRGDQGDGGAGDI